jgi:15-cis-phytoene desaturase
VAIDKGITLRDGAQLRADHVVAAVPPQDLKSLGRDAPSIEPSPYISSYLWFDRKLTRERFWALLGAQKNLNSDFYDLSNIRRGWAGRPSLIASNIIYSHRAAPMSDAQVVAATQREIAEYIPQAAAARVVRAVVNRIAMAIPCPLPQSEGERPDSAVSGSLSVAGDWTRTGLPCSMESAVRSGWLAAEEVLRAAGRPRSLALAPRPRDGLAGLIQRFRPNAARGPAWRTLPTARPRPHP